MYLLGFGLARAADNLENEIRQLAFEMLLSLAEKKAKMGRGRD